MCIATVALIAGIAGTGITAAGQLEAGNYAGQVATNNATIERQNAQYSREAGTQEATTESLKGASQLAKTKTALAANGTDVNTGSAVDVLTSERGANQLDAETALNNADLQAYGYTTKAVDQEAEAKQDETGGIYNALGTIASKASSINWSNWGSLAGGSAGATPEVP